eukprot:CAMPEP_0176264040 /NCGR_PEP_ID=MMETSP0121_2-20121125/41427_1 /TAXON_ID=160619 /ORGANISM="Kryptoperidinium foliaceum, Strain CCMP 1326" /LENGTH=212 /DNA_ID=CAMNT_0017604037 /DNA_START=36 /DNA_END=674 /DNA_ORIENTATION=+
MTPAEREPLERKHRRVQLEYEKAKKKFVAAGGSLPDEAKVKKEPEKRPLARKAADATPKKKKRLPLLIPQSRDLWIQDHAQAILKEFPKSLRGRRGFMQRRIELRKRWDALPAEEKDVYRRKRAVLKAEAQGQGEDEDRKKEDEDGRRRKYWGRRQTDAEVEFWARYVIDPDFGDEEFETLPEQLDPKSRRIFVDRKGQGARSGACAPPDGS